MDNVNALRSIAEMPINLSVEQIGALQAGIKALQEQAERENGCEYCGQVSKSIDNGEDGNSRAILYLSANNKHIHYMDAKGKLAIFDINYCPICGRELEVNNE